MAGNTTDLEIIFGAKSFSDFLDKMELVEALSDYDNNLITSIQGDLENISKEKAELEKDMDSLEAEEASLESDQQELNKILEENKELLAGLYKTSDKATSEIQNGALESDDIERLFLIITLKRQDLRQSVPSRKEIIIQTAVAHQAVLFTVTLTFLRRVLYGRARAITILLPNGTRTEALITTVQLI